MAQYLCWFVKLSINLLLSVRLMVVFFDDKINSLDHPTDLAFNLTESPWIRAGRQYSVRVSSCLLARK